MKQKSKHMELKYSKTFNAHLADKPILLNDQEKCLSITHDEFKICDPFEDKLDKIQKYPIYFHKLEDRKIWVSLDLFTKDNPDSPKGGRAECGYQMVLIDKGTHYNIDYQDHFITGDIRGGDDFQKLTSSWQW